MAITSKTAGKGNIKEEKSPTPEVDFNPVQVAAEITGEDPNDLSADIVENEVRVEKKPKINKEEVNPLTLLPQIVRNNGVEDVVLLKMTRGNYSWTTATGIIFTKDNPFQLVPKDEAAELKKDGFVEVAPEEVLAYYNS